MKYKQVRQVWILIFILPALLFPIQVFGSIDEEVKMQKALEALKQGRNSEAKVLFQEIWEAGYYSYSLFVNTGLLHESEGEWGWALLNYERALRLRPGKEEGRRLVQGVQLNLKDNILFAPGFFDSRAALLLGIFMPWEWVTAGLICWWASFVLLGLARSKGWSFAGQVRSLVTGIIISGLVFFLFGWARQQQISREDFAILLEDSGLHMGPDVSSPVVQQLYEGNKVLLVEGVGDWLLIELGNGKQGWIDKTDLQTISW